ncbi:hypothetical protein [Vibrio sp. TRT 17S01]|uniref:hypothetical protein n=1 Tax=Vibrio sp. TRT 17S01 TaxID=3418505 RepID=UPI003CF89E0D
MFVSRFILFLLCGVVSILCPFYLNAVELDDLEYRNDIYYLNDTPYTGSAELNRIGDNIYYRRNPDYEVKVRSYLKFVGYFEKGKRNGEWTTYLLVNHIPIKIVETYDEGELRQVEHLRASQLNHYDQDKLYRRHLIGKRLANTQHWEWKVQKSTDVYYTGHSVGVSAPDKVLYFAKHLVFKKKSMTYLTLYPERVKYQLFHILPVLQSEDAHSMSEGPVLSTRYGKWRYFEKNELTHTKSYIHGQDPTSYNIEEHWGEDGGTCVRKFTDENMRTKKKESLLFNENKQLTNVRSYQDGSQLLFDLRFYPNGNKQWLISLLADKQHYLKLEYYPTGELYRETYFSDISFFDFIPNSFDGERAGPDRYFDRTGKMVIETIARNNPPSLEYFDQNKMNQKTMPEPFYEGC